MDKSDIEQLIPNRDPWIWIDEVVEVSDNAIHARKWLDPSIDVFHGYYPEFPLLSGVIQCEACLEASAVLIAKPGVSTGRPIPAAAQLNNVKCHRMVCPGETLDIHVELVNHLQHSFYFTGRVDVDDEIVTSLEFVTTAAHARG